VSHRLHLAGKDASNEVLYFEKYEETCMHFFPKHIRDKTLLKNDAGY